MEARNSTPVKYIVDRREGDPNALFYPIKITEVPASPPLVAERCVSVIKHPLVGTNGRANQGLERIASDSSVWAAGALKALSFDPPTLREQAKRLSHEAFRTMFDRLQSAGTAVVTQSIIQGLVPTNGSGSVASQRVNGISINGLNGHK